MEPRVWPYWWQFGRGRHVGYLPSREGNGTWHARYATRDETRTRYRQYILGKADDYTDADGGKVLNFGQAVDAARRWIATHEHEAVRPDFTPSPDRLLYCPVGDVSTVGHAVLDYLRFAMMYRKAPQIAMYRANRYILPHIGTIAADELTSEQLREWLEMVAKSPAKRGTGRLLDNPTLEDRQRRRHTANAVYGSLTAALNLAFRDGKIANDVAWRRVRKFRDIQRARVRYLSEDEARAVVAVCPPDFRDVVLAGLYTGCRSGELIAMQVGALDQKTDRLYVAPGKSYWARWLALPDEGIAFFRDLSRGRPEGEPMFLRKGRARWRVSVIQACMVNARKKAKLDNSVVLHTLRHTYARYLVMAGASLLGVMKLLGHADIRLVVSCYAHLSPDFLADTVRLHFPRFMGGGRSAPREWSEAATAYANPAAAAAQRWAALRRRTPPDRITYEHLAGKV